MRTIVAAIDAGAAAGPVLATASALGQALGLQPVALHAQPDDPAAARALAVHAGVPMREVTSAPAAAILAALDDPQVAMGVLGARGQPTDRRAASRTTLAVVTSAAKPVVVVPLGLPVGAWGQLSPVVVPLDGTQATAEAVAPAVRWLASAGLEVVVVHVFDQATTPRFWDHPGHTQQAWSQEFLARQLPTPAARLELRAGRAAGRVLDVATAEHAGLLLLAWSQDVTGQRAPLVRELLARTRVLLLLLPALGRAAKTPSWPDRRTLRRPVTTGLQDLRSPANPPRTAGAARDTSVIGASGRPLR